MMGVLLVHTEIETALPFDRNAALTGSSALPVGLQKRAAAANASNGKRKLSEAPADVEGRSGSGQDSEVPAKKPAVEDNTQD